MNSEHGKRKILRPAKSGIIPSATIAAAVKKVKNNRHLNKSKGKGMLDKRWLVIEKDYSVSYSNVETGHLRSRCRRGEISLIDTKKMAGMNLAENQYEMGEFSDLKEYSRVKE